MTQAEFACVVFGCFWNPNNGILGQAAWGKSAYRAASATAKMITSCAARGLPDQSKGGRPGGPQCTPSYAVTGLAALHTHRAVLVRPDGLRGVAALLRRLPGRFPPPPRLPRRPDRPAGRARDRSLVAQHRRLRPGDAGDGLRRPLGLDAAVLSRGRLRLDLVRAKHRADARNARHVLLLDAPADAPSPAVPAPPPYPPPPPAPPP